MTSQMHDHYVPEWTLGDRFRRIRRDAGLTQPTFAARLGVKPKTYAAWESDVNQPRGGQLLALARRIEVMFGDDAGRWLLGVETRSDPSPGGSPGTGDDWRARRYSKPQPSDPKVLVLAVAA